jgi:L-fuconolactonase
MAGIDEQWIALGEEVALEPDLPICDPHHHLWDYPGSRYMLDELLADVADHRVLTTVFVECGSMYAADFSESEKAALFHDTAVRVSRL